MHTLSPDLGALLSRFSTGNLPIGIAYVNRQAVVVFSNPAFQNLFAAGKQPATGWPLGDVVAPECWPKIEPFVRQALAGTAVCFEAASQGEQGLPLLRISCLPDIGGDGAAPAGFLVLVEDVTGRRQMEAALNASEATLRAVFESASQGIIGVDRTGRICFHNRMAETIFGYAGGQLADQPLEALMPTRLGEVHARHRANYFHEPHTRAMGLGMVLTARRADGTEFPVEVSLSHIGGESQTPLAIAFITDVTESHRLKEERNQFFNLSADLSCVVGLDGYFKQVNQSFLRVLGWSKGELLSRPLFELVHPEDRAGAEAALANLTFGQPVDEFLNRYRCKDGSYRWLSWTARPAAPGAELVYAAARDVTVELGAKAERQRLVTLIENSTDCIALVSPDGRFLFLNAAGWRLAGYLSAEEAQAASISELFDATDMLAAVQRGERWHAEVALRNRLTQTEVPLDMNAFAVLTSGDPVVALVARDIRRRKRDQQQLQALAAQLLSVQEEERRRIARDLHDDITQKLAMLGIEFGLINRDLAQSAAVGQEKLSALHEQILQLSEDVRQISHQLHPSVLEHSGLGPALEAFCRDISKQTGIRIAAVTRDVPPDLPQPVAVGLYRIAQEAVRNIAKHAQARSASVTLSGGGSGRLRLAIIDDGGGFDAEAIESHAGLGIVSMQERARLINGRLQVNSLPGEGTSIAVEVDLPSRGSGT